MDIFDILTAISRRKKALMHNGIDEKKALIEAELDVSREYHIPIFDIKKLVKI